MIDFLSLPKLQIIEIHNVADKDKNSKKVISRLIGRTLSEGADD